MERAETLGSACAVKLTDIVACARPTPFTHGRDSPSPPPLLQTINGLKQDSMRDFSNDTVDLPPPPLWIKGTG